MDHSGDLLLSSALSREGSFQVLEFSELKEVALRCLKLRCPACGQSSIVSRPFHIRHHCDSCRSLFKREDGFFVGAILANVVTTELMILVLWFVLVLFVGSNYDSLLGVLFALALIFPLAFYHHSWSFWLGLDYLVESLPKYTANSHKL
jgi:uncharacterized protein (DUF983 family)